MGIPYYFYSLTQKYTSILVDALPFQPDIYCIDFNGIIHTTAQEILKNEGTSQVEEKIIEGVWNKVGKYIEIMKPNKLVICADGVAPIAKIAQQRKRRYLNVFKHMLDKTEIKWDTNAITPGTEFMNKLNIFMKKQVRYNSKETNIIYSGSDENGEGEHKIFDKLAVDSDMSKIIIHGLDADLIILSLISHKKQIYLMRESIQKDNTQVCNYLNIHELRIAIIKELVTKWNIQSCDVTNPYSSECNDLVESYCVACSILGNDFIPHLLTIDLKSDGLDKLQQVCKEAYDKYGLLIKDGVIDHVCLSEIFAQLAKSEDVTIYSSCEKYIKKTVQGKSELDSDLYALKNKSTLAHNIYNNPSKWRHEYYKELFDSNITLSSYVISQACENYIKGIYWTYAYYKKKELDFHWYYPFTYPPSVKDIANHSMANEKPVICNVGDFIPSYIQLLLVLPRESKHLMKKKYQMCMENYHSGLFHLYPKKYKIQTFLKTHLWECSPILPTINIKFIQRVLEE